MRSRAPRTNAKACGFLPLFPVRSVTIGVARKLLGCMADGKTYQHAVANARRVIEEWSETARALGRPVPEPKGRLSLRSRTSTPI